MQHLGSLDLCPAMLPLAAQCAPHLPVSGPEGAKLKDGVEVSVELLQAGQGKPGGPEPGRAWLLREGVGARLLGAQGAGRRDSRHPRSIQSCRAQQGEPEAHRAHAGTRLHSVIV